MTDEEDKILSDINHLKGRVKVAVVLERAAESFKQGNLEQALQLSEEAILLDPQSAIAHNKRAIILMQMNRLDEAVVALKKAIQLQPDVENAKYLLAALGHDVAPEQSPKTYVSKLFDFYADRFDEDLVDNLDYKTPQHLYQLVTRHIDTVNSKLDILDLGCGTGLCGVVFAGLARDLIGVDLSGKMLEKAEKHGIYSELIQGDISSILENTRRQFDLVLSGDVFVYLGNLSKIFRLVRQRMNSGGFFAFSIEVNESDEYYKLQSSCRYKHSPEYIYRLGKECGLVLIERKPVTLRYEGNLPVTGNVFLLCAEIEMPSNTD